MPPPVYSADGPPVRVLHVNSMLTGGGTDDQCVKLVQGLLALGQSVWLAGPAERALGRRARADGMPLSDTGAAGPLKLGFIVRCARLIRRHAIQIIHGHHGRDLWPTILAALLSGRRPRIVLTRHMAKSPSSWPSRRFLLGQCDALVAVSEFTARVLREGVNEPRSPEPERRRRPPLLGDHAKIVVIHGGLDTARFQPRPADDSTVLALRQSWGLSPEHFAFAVMGGYELPRGKGQREFLQAAATLRDKLPLARFLMVGGGSLRDTLLEDIERLGLRGCTTLAPWCGDMPAAMNAIDCLVHPQVGTEAFGLVVCEAHACGRPVIASALDGIPEAFAIGGQGRLVAPESVPELAAAMLAEFHAPRLDASHRRILHDHVAARASLSVLAEKSLELYRRLLNSARPPNS